MSFAATTNPTISVLGGSRDWALADAGNYYVATTPTPGTGIVVGVVNTFVETTPCFTVYNGGLVNIYPEYLKLTGSTTDAVTDSAVIFLTNTLDVGNRYSSGGSTCTAVNTNWASSNASGAIIKVGAITASAASASRRVVSHAQVRSLKVPVLHDTTTINWGNSSQSLTALLANNTTTHTDVVINHAPIVIGPGQSMSLVYWAVSQTVAPKFEVEFGFVEK